MDSVFWVDMLVNFRTGCVYLFLLPALCYFIVFGLTDCVMDWHLERRAIAEVARLCFEAHPVQWRVFAMQVLRCARLADFEAQSYCMAIHQSTTVLICAGFEYL